MKEMNIFIKMTMSTFLAYATIALLIFVYTDTNWIIRAIGIGACAIGDFVYKWEHVEKIFDIWIKKLE